MKWEELIAEARSAGVLAFCADGIAVLNRDNAKSPESSARPPAETREQRGQGGQGQSESADQSAST
jgi:hypothetical protein